MLQRLKQRLRQWWYGDPTIFYFSDGVMRRRVDALVVFDWLHADPQFNLKIHPQLIDDGNREARVIGANAVRRALRIPPFERGGLSETACLNLMIRLCEFIGDLRDRKIVFPVGKQTSDDDFQANELFAVNASRGGE